MRTTHITIPVPAELHVNTRQLVATFAEALAAKFREAELKYGHADGWLWDDWEEECRRGLMEHVAKGDPRDVAIYAAFLWHRGWSTAAPVEG
ncbi:hypothetical protein PQJ75_14005 [Rhodoplanes sp. TEM]|uniref:Uncharacterized protein n=1 Tax=Rhodoplanes tepidamans TaxID=200616 RepID=A0ABT5JEF5_RHOTP|nr:MULTISPECIES: hypothetical protein [Rhodoplanes]MDC7788006.1 hypothetical protein [Rhodoplanes tepidamans]MDC7984846.1 hypothetical protein [Rhodoplanes sp. TEM]MDQ0358435.1 hypothetical protein [Rhodoplanes tepidamans]